MQSSVTIVFICQCDFTSVEIYRFIALCITFCTFPKVSLLGTILTIGHGCTRNLFSVHRKIVLPKKKLNRGRCHNLVHSSVQSQFYNLSKDTRIIWRNGNDLTLRHNCGRRLTVMLELAALAWRQRWSMLRMLAKSKRRVPFQQPVISYTKITFNNYVQLVHLR